MSLLSLSLWHLSFSVFRKQFQHSHLNFSITNLSSLVSLGYYITSPFQKHHHSHILHLVTKWKAKTSITGVTFSHTAATCRKGGSNASFPISSHSHLWFLTLYTLVGWHPPTLFAPEFCPYKSETPKPLACFYDYRTVSLPCCWFFILEVVFYNNILSKDILYKRLSSGEILNHTPPGITEFVDCEKKKKAQIFKLFRNILNKYS